MTRTPFARPPAPTAHDLKLWDALVEKALKSAERPDRGQDQLRRAADRAYHARIPIRERHRESPFYHLVTLSRSWWAASADAREILAPQLRAYAQAVAEILNDPAGAEAGRRVLPPGDR